MSLPSGYDERKGFPLLTFLTAYFPDHIEAMVELSKKGNVQHDTFDSQTNPFGLPYDRIRWDRTKSIEQCETLMRHLWDHMRALRGVGSLYDADGVLHITKVGWRSGAEGQLTIERERYCPEFPQFIDDGVARG